MAKSIKLQYWRYSLFALILGLGAVIFVKITPFLGGLLGAATLYILLRGQMRRLTEKKRWRPSLAAGLMLVETVLCFLIPLSGVVWMLVSRVQDVTLDPQTLLRPIASVAALIQEKTGYDPLQTGNLNSLIGVLPRIGQWIMGSIGGFVINIFVLLFVLYFMLIGGRRMEDYFREILPFDKENAREMLYEIHLIVRSNAIGIPLLAVAQGFVAYIGYLIFGAPAPVFWGVITCFATVIPLLGTTLVWLPLALYMGFTGGWGPAVGLIIYASIVITHVDNLVRFVLQKKMADTHPLVTFFGVVIGLSLFGFMGVIFGPLLIAVFILCMRIFKKQYLEGKPGPAMTSEPSDSADRK